MSRILLTEFAPRRLRLRVKKPIQQRRRLRLRARHQVAVEVKRDLDRGMAHEDRERLEVRVLGAMEPSIGSHDSRTLIVAASRSMAPQRSARNSP